MTKICCEACGSTKNITKHHLRPRHLGGKENKENIMFLCRECHNVVDKDSSLTIKEIELIQKYPILGILFTNKVWNKQIYCKKTKKKIKY